MAANESPKGGEPEDIGVFKVVGVFKDVEEVNDAEAVIFDILVEVGATAGVLVCRDG